MASNEIRSGLGLVLASYTSTDGATPTATVLDYNNKIIDNYNAVTPGAGTWVFTAPKTGVYTIAAGFYSATSAGQKYIRVNLNGIQIALSYTNNTVTYINNVSAQITISLVVGDQIQVLTDWSAALQTGAGQNTISIIQVN